MIRGANLVKPIIVGLDPGTTVGISILDIEGNILKIASIRNASRSDIIKYVSKFGKPIIIASDVNPPPKQIDKLSSSIGCKTFYPEVSLSNVEKMKLIREYRDKIKDLHQKDSLAAAVKAFRNFHYLFLKVEEILEKQEKKNILNEVIEMMIKKRNVNIIDTVRKILKRVKK